MAAWFRRRRPLGEAPRLTPRGESASKRDRVDLADLTPELLPYLGQVAYLQLAVFEALARGVAGTDDLADKEAISAAAGTALAKHHAVVAELRRRDVEPSEAMAPFRPAIDTFEHLTRGADLHETLLSAYITAGLLDDFFIRLTGGLPNDVGPRMAQTLGAAGLGQPGLGRVPDRAGLHRADRLAHPPDGRARPDGLTRRPPRLAEAAPARSIERFPRAGACSARRSSTRAASRQLVE